MKGRDIAIMAAGAALFLVLSIPLAGSMTDDTYIHMQYARNLVETGQLAFNRGDPVYGATSPLWVFILAAVYRLGGDLAVWSGVLSVLFGVCCAAGTYLLSRRLGSGRPLAAAASMMMAGDAWLLRWSNVGMETSMAVFMVILCVISAASSGDSKRGSAMFGILLFLAYLARPESLLLAPLAGAAFLWSGRGKGSAGRFVWALVFVPLLVAWLFMIKGHTGTFFPLTAGAKQGQALNLSTLAARIAVPLKIVISTALVPFAAMAVYLAGWIFRAAGIPPSMPRGARRGALLALLWIFALPAAYVVMDFQILSRYMVPVSPFIIVFGVIAAEGLSGAAGRIRMRPGSAAALVAAVFLAQSIIFYSAVVVGPTREFSKGLKTVIAGMGVWLAENSDEGSVVAAPDIGAIGYFSGRRVLDLGGLVSAEINRMRSTIDVDRIIDEGLYLDLGADYLLDRSVMPERFSGKTIRGFKFRPVAKGEVDNLGIRQNWRVTYVLYALEKEDAGD